MAGWSSDNPQNKPKSPWEAKQKRRQELYGLLGALLILSPLFGLYMAGIDITYIVCIGLPLFIVLLGCIGLAQRCRGRRGRVAVAPAGPTVAAAPAHVVAPAFDAPLAGGGQFCASCGQVPTPCLLVRSTLVGEALAYAYQRDARAAKTGGGQVLRGAAAANTRSFTLAPRLPDSTAATAAPGAS